MNTFSERLHLSSSFILVLSSLLLDFISLKSGHPFYHQVKCDIIEFTFWVWKVSLDMIIHQNIIIGVEAKNFIGFNHINSIYDISVVLRNDIILKFFLLLQNIISWGHETEIFSVLKQLNDWRLWLAFWTMGQRLCLLGFFLWFSLSWGGNWLLLRLLVFRSLLLLSLLLLLWLLLLLLRLLLLNLDLLWSNWGSLRLESDFMELNLLSISSNRDLGRSLSCCFLILLFLFCGQFVNLIL
jgi:hypothetical protein